MLFLPDNTDPIHEHYTFDNKSIRKKYENMQNSVTSQHKKVQKHCISIIELKVNLNESAANNLVPLAPLGAADYCKLEKH